MEKNDVRMKVAHVDRRHIATLIKACMFSFKGSFLNAFSFTHLMYVENIERMKRECKGKSESESQRELSFIVLFPKCLNSWAWIKTKTGVEGISGSPLGGRHWSHHLLLGVHS